MHVSIQKTYHWRIIEILIFKLSKFGKWKYFCNKNFNIIFEIEENRVEMDLESNIHLALLAHASLTILPRSKRISFYPEEAFSD